MKPRASGQRRVIPGSPFNVPDPGPGESYDLDDQVVHDRHGLGRVIEKTGDHEVVVNFGSTCRRIPLPSIKLTKL